ncbi:MAG TPA: DUF389 domain-containing protein [Blastocatellia bacterium]|nr:DUF389 domain-containing protein [Blastocatellia bacterium]
MTLNEPPLPPEPAFPPRSRRRRRSQLAVPQDAEGRAALLHSLSRRAYPSYELFVFALLCGAILGLGYFFDSQAVLIFGILLAPLLTPWIGLLLSALTGSTRFFFETLVALLIGSVLIFLSGLLAGFAVRAFLPRTLNEAFLHSRLWWLDLIVLAIAAVILTVSFVRSEEKPYLPSVMLAYEFFLPLSAGGFGLGSGIADIWPQGVLVFVVHFAWASLFGMLTLIAFRFLPKSLNGFALSTGSLLVIVVTLVLLMTGGSGTLPSMLQSVSPTSISSVANLALNPTTVPTATPSPEGLPEASPTPLIETSTEVTDTATLTPAVSTLEATLPPADTPTPTLTIEPTPVYARIDATQANGANLRKEPNGTFILELDNGTIVEVQPDTQDVNGVVWAHVIAIRSDQRYEGWILQSVLDIATPVPIWNPTATPASTLTPAETDTPGITSTP